MLAPVGCAAVKVREHLLPWAPFEADLGPLNSFHTRSERFSEDYQLFPCGFTAAPILHYAAAR